MNSRICSLLVGVTVLPALACAQVGNVIQTVFVGGSPFIECGTERTFTVTVRGIWPTAGGDLYAQAFDDDGILNPDDPLSSELYLPIPGSYTEEARFTFIIGCTPFPECDLYGIDAGGSRLLSGESTAELYVKVRFIGTGRDEIAYSPTVEISCVPTPGALSMALGGGLIVARRQRRTAAVVK